MSKIAVVPLSVVVRSGFDVWSRWGDFVHPVVECKELEFAAIQSARDECDVNKIVERFTDKVSGEFMLPALTPPVFADVVGADFRAMQDFILQAQASFDSLPAKLRKRFNNDPREFLEFCSDEANQAEMRALGMLPPEEGVTPSGGGEISSESDLAKAEGQPAGDPKGAEVGGRPGPAGGKPAV